MATRAATIDWEAVAASLDRLGYATVPGLLTSAEATDLAALYDDDPAYRSRVVMQHHGYGRGEYRYFRYPLPDIVAALRHALYAPLVPIANRWRQRLGAPERFPATLDAYTAECHANGQTRPTPLLLKYREDDYNCLHQDLYGPLLFPLQATVLLSDPATAFAGGEFMLVEQRPRAQSRGEVVPLGWGDAVIFPVHHRPVDGTRGAYRMTMRHGVSRIRSGNRLTLGLIFHDAA